MPAMQGRDNKEVITMLAYGLLAAVSARTCHEWLINPSVGWPTQENFRTWCQNMDSVTGAVLVVAGFIFLFHGFKNHRMLIGFTGATLGAYLGGGVALKMGMPIWMGLALGIMLLGTFSYFFTSWAAAAVGAVCGAMLGASIWLMLPRLDPAYAWSGAMTGAVALGLLCSLIFRMSVIAFTSMQGAVMLPLGVLGMAYDYHSLRDSLDRSFSSLPYVLPATIIGLAILGCGYQYMCAPAGGAAGGGGKSSGGKSGGESKPKDSSAKKEKAAAKE